MSTRCTAWDRGRGLPCMCDNHRPFVKDAFERRSRPESRITYDAFARDRDLPHDIVHSSSWFEIVLDPMREGDFGEIDLDSRPFRIRINPNVAQPRLEVSTAHELLHAVCELYKIDMSHDALHNLAVFFASELFPAFAAVQRVTADQR